MNLEQIKAKVSSDEYDFIRKDKSLGNNIIILTLGGSHAYGTNTENSDLDVRGCALNSKMQILTNQSFEQFINEETDTVIYSFNKLISLLINANPNTIEMLGNKAEHYLYVHPIGQELIDNAHLFLSKKAVYSFGGYANQQLRRLETYICMDIRNGKYLDENKQPAPEFYEIVNEYEKRLDYAKRNTSLPDNPHYDKINEFTASVNERVVRDEL